GYCCCGAGGTKLGHLEHVHARDESEEAVMDPAANAVAAGSDRGEACWKRRVSDEGSAAALHEGNALCGPSFSESTGPIRSDRECDCRGLGERETTDPSR